MLIHADKDCERPVYCKIVVDQNLASGTPNRAMTESLIFTK